MIKFPYLFSPIVLGGVTYKNRIFSAPITFRDLSGEGELTAQAAAFYELRAKGGAAEVTVSELTVNGIYGRTYPNNTSADTKNVKVGLAVCADAIRIHGCVPSVELNHGGKFAVGENLIGPSDDTLPDGRKVRGMTVSDIDTVVREFASAAILAKHAGYRAVLLHGGHGWLIEQFLSPADNKRTDRYGGCLRNRSRFALEVIEAVRAEVGSEFPIEIRVSADEYREGGYSFRDLIEFTCMLEGKVDLINVSTGGHENSFDRTHQTMFVPRGGLVRFAASVKEKIKTPVAAIGAIAEPEMAEQIIRDGKADVVYMGRQLLADPMLPIKAMAGRENEIVRCCRCFTCQGERMVSGLRVCSLNPVIGREFENRNIPPARERKNVLVVGGGPAGMTAAISAAGRGHNVVLCERSDSLGGALREEKWVSFKQDLYRWIDVKSAELKRSGVDVRLGVCVTADLARELAPDVIIVAAGTEALVPSIPGICSDNVIMSDRLAECIERTGDRVVVLGGGLVGCESAVELSLRGKDVTVLEMRPTAAADANPRHGHILLEKLCSAAKLLLNTRATEITDEGVVCIGGTGEKFVVPADSVICAAGRKADTSLYNEMIGCAERVIPIGDCFYPGNMAGAISGGYYAGLDI